MDDPEIVARYLAYYRKRRDEDFAGFDELEEIRRRDPEHLWTVTQALLHACSNLGELCYIAAGPLEDLLRDHGERFWPLIQETAGHDQALRQALGAVWPGSGWKLSVRKAFERFRKTENIEIL